MPFGFGHKHIEDILVAYHILAPFHIFFQITGERIISVKASDKQMVKTQQQHYHRRKNHNYQYYLYNRTHIYNNKYGTLWFLQNSNII